MSGHSQPIDPEASKCLSCAHAVEITLQKAIPAQPSPLMPPGQPLGMQIVHARIISCPKLSLTVGDIVVECGAYEAKPDEVN